MNTDPYVELGIGYTATQDEIKRAYRTLARQYHPDKTNNDEQAKIRFIRIQNAYQFLSDPIKKRDFDNEREKNLWQGRNNQNWGNPQNNRNIPFGMSESMFNGLKNVANFVADNFFSEEEQIDPFIEDVVNTSVSSNSRGIDVKLNITKAKLNKIRSMMVQGQITGTEFADQCGQIISRIIQSQL